MDHDLYIGKPLKHLIQDCPSFALNFYLVGNCGDGYKNLKDIMNNHTHINKVISNISQIHSDYSIYIELEG